MANPQLENGFVRIANEIMEAIYKTKFNGTQFRIVLAVIRCTYGFNRKEHEMSDNFIAESTGINVRNIKRELKKLIENNVIIVTSEGSYTEARKVKINKNYDDWLIESVVTNKPLGGELVTSGENATTGGGELTVTQNEEKSDHSPDKSDEINSLTEGSGELDTSGELTTQKRQYKDNIKDIATTTKGEGSGELTPTENKDELSIFANLICDHYSILTGRLVTPRDDMTIFNFAQTVTDKDVQLVKSAMSRAKQNWIPKFDGDQIRSFKYFIPAIKEALAVKEGKKSSGSDKQNNKHVPRRKDGTLEVTGGMREFRVPGDE